MIRGMNAHLLAEMSRLNDRIHCGETGFLQCSAWVALDLGIPFDQWTVAVAEFRELAPTTLRKQWRLAEADRNACLVDDGQADEQTRWGLKKVVTTSVTSN